MLLEEGDILSPVGRGLSMRSSATGSGTLTLRGDVLAVGLFRFDDGDGPVSWDTVVGWCVAALETVNRLE